MRQHPWIYAMPALALLALGGCTVQETDEGVEVEPARVEIERDTQRVRVGSDTYEVRVPRVDVEPADSPRTR